MATPLNFTSSTMNSVKNSVENSKIPSNLPTCPSAHASRNAAERAIQTWKNYFLAGIATLDPNFPIQEWYRLLPQCDIALNLLRSSHRQPNISAYAATFGNFNFNRTPLAPRGTGVLVQETTKQRTSFTSCRINSWYIGPSLDHYRCYSGHIPSTAGIRDAILVEWFMEA